ncbi:hypothetical protein FGG78_23130 [Thioclava sp. BHET1]|nr:hypothetical protein FGG78_23130 [Thioclava sp. BHET1]
MTIATLAEQMARITGFHGRIRFDATRPDGTPRKLLDVGRLSALGWSARIALPEGIARTYAWFLEQRLELREA